MKTITSAAPVAGAQENCVRTASPGFRPVLRRCLLSTVKRLRSDLGLTTGDILVLDSLLSFLPCRDKTTGADTPVTPQTMLVIYASNASICSRANGMDERVLRRHVGRLTERGLLMRRDSATGKRFPLRAGGKISGAYGLDLTPLLERSDELDQRARDLDARAEEARSLRATALTIRAGLLRASHRLTEEALAFVEQSKTILRRTTLTLEDIRGIIDGLSRIDHGQSEGRNGCEDDPSATPATITRTDRESATNGADVRQVESRKTDTNIRHTADRDTMAATWAACSNISEFFPSAPERPAELTETVYMMGSFIGLKERSLADAIATIGWQRILQVLDYLVGHAGRITNPDGYLAKMLRDFRAGKPIAGMT